MRALLSFLIASAATVSGALAQDKPKVRPASEFEIRHALKDPGNMKQDQNGYQYRENSKIGYKISDGKICVLQKKKSSCATVYSDGKRLEMIDERGNREFLN